MDITQTAFTDEQDDASGTTAAITADGFSPGATVEFKVEHVVDGGPDEVLGADDDTRGDNSGNGHYAWLVNDGGEGDLDGVVNGKIQTTWFVDPDDSADATFLRSATGVSAGADGLLGTADDEATGELAARSFTESGRSELARNQCLFKLSKPTKPRFRPDRLVWRFRSVSRNTVSHSKA